MVDFIDGKHFIARKVIEDNTDVFLIAEGLLEVDDVYEECLVVIITKNSEPQITFRHKDVSL